MALRLHPGFIFFMLVQKDMIGWYILPLGIVFTLWVLIKKIRREQFMCYFGLSLIWMIMAVVLDYLFILLLLGSVDYYMLDVYINYALTFVLPLAVGLYKRSKGEFRDRKS